MLTILFCAALIYVAIKMLLWGIKTAWGPFGGLVSFRRGVCYNNLVHLIGGMIHEDT